MKIEQRKFSLGNHSVMLYFSEDELFIPNATTRLFTKVIQIHSGDTVFDIGSGVGPLAVWAALEPSKSVHAVEVVEKQCEHLRRNIELNNVADKVCVHKGNLFDPIPSGLKSDVIIGDVSGIAEGPARSLGWYPLDIPTGGKDGTEVIIPLIEQAGKYLTDGGRLYFPVAIGLSDSEKIIQIATENFSVLERVIDVTFPLTEQQRAAILESSDSAPYISIVQRGSRYVWKGRIYEATSPKKNS